MTGWEHVAPPPQRVGPAGWVRVLWRGTLIGSVTYGGLLVLLLVRLIEWPLFGQARPVTPHITRLVCRTALFLLRLPLVVHGRPMTRSGAIVANHSSWLDVFVLNAVQTVYFVAKAEVAAWPLIGWLARATGTVFIARKGTEAKKQQEIFEARLQAGHRLLFFPEGTSNRRGPGPAVQEHAFPGLLRPGPGPHDAYPARHCGLPRARRRRSPALWLVGGHGLCQPLAEDAGHGAAGTGRGDLSPRGAGRCLREPQGPVHALRTGDPHRPCERGTLRRATPPPAPSA